MDIKDSIHSLLRKCKYILKAPYRKRIIADANKKKKLILSEKRKQSRKQIKVGFVVQMPEIWDKEAPLYEALLEDKRFDVYLIIVPHYDFANNKLGQFGDEREFFVERYTAANIVLLNSPEDKVIDSSYDYIFYQRCWEDYLPEQMRCKNVINYAMTCYIPYCYHCTPMLVSYYQTDFFWFLSKFYCCSDGQYNQVSKIGNIECQFFGFPVLDSLHYEDNKHEKINILWTPRWSDDLSLGGSTFNRNKNLILELTKIPEVNLTLRPHPLTFENAIKEHWMTPEEIEEYKNHVNESGASFDSNKLIEDSFRNTDILITDFSSAIVTFFFTGKPIIYCSGSDFVMDETFRTIMDSVYIATNWTDVQRCVLDLTNGADPLYNKRQEVIKNISNPHLSVSRIIEDLYRTLNP